MPVPTVTVADVLAHVAFEANRPIETIVGRPGRGVALELRTVAAWLAYSLTDAPVGQIATAFGHRQTATFYQHLARAETLLARDREFCALADRLTVTLKAAA